MLLGALLVVLGACAEDATECGRGPGVVQVGQGGSRLRALPETGGELPIVLGSQGGIHVLVGFRARDMDLEMDVEYRLVDPGSQEVVGTPTTLALRPTLFSREGADAVRNPDLVVLNNEEPRVEDFAGRVVRLELEAMSADSHACDAREVTLLPPE